MCYSRVNVRCDIVITLAFVDPSIYVEYSYAALMRPGLGQTSDLPENNSSRVISRARRTVLDEARGFGEISWADNLKNLCDLVSNLQTSSAQSHTLSPVPDTTSETEKRVQRRRAANKMSSAAWYQRNKGKASAAAAARYQASKCWCSVCHKLSSRSHFNTVDHRDNLWQWMKTNGEEPDWQQSDKVKRDHLRFWRGSACGAPKCLWCPRLAEG